MQLTNVVVDFAGKKVLNDITMTFQQGELIGLVAPNGTGKSTLMNVIMNYVTPTAGEVSFKGGLRYSSKQNEVKIHQFVSMMPDQSDLYNHLSGRAHLAMYATMWGSDKRLIQQTIDMLQMGHYVDKKTGTYSLGMRQRLCFAMQIVANTDIMLMDEVMNGLDPNNVEIISRILLQKRAEGKLIIIASHLLDNLEKYADRIFLFKDGQLVYVNDIVEGFGTNRITAVRVKQLSEAGRQAVKQAYPQLKMETLVNEMTIISLDRLQVDAQATLMNILTTHGAAEITFGRVTLNDLYAMYYHEIQ